MMNKEKDVKLKERKITYLIQIDYKKKHLKNNLIYNERYEDLTV